MKCSEPGILKQLVNDSIEIVPLNINKEQRGFRLNSCFGSKANIFLDPFHWNTTPPMIFDWSYTGYSAEVKALNLIENHFERLRNTLGGSFRLAHSQAYLQKCIDDKKIKTIKELQENINIFVLDLVGSDIYHKIMAANYGERSLIYVRNIEGVFNRLLSKEVENV